jgi:uncharacterized membrane protein
MTDLRILRAGFLAALGLLGLVIAWHAWLAPPRADLRWPTLALAALPLVPGLWIARSDMRRGVLVCGIVCLFYFAHGVSALWVGSVPVLLPALEIAFALVVIAALGWDARHYKRPEKSDGGEQA